MARMQKKGKPMKFMATVARAALVWLVASAAGPLAGAEDANAKVKNLLPNASFELPLGQGLPWNWLDMLNPLTMGLTATDQAPKGYPETWWRGLENGTGLP